MMTNFLTTYFNEYCASSTCGLLHGQTNQTYFGYYSVFSRLRGRMVPSVVFTTTMNATSVVQLSPKLVVVSLDKMFHNGSLSLSLST